MNDKSNILGSLEESTKSMDLKQQQQAANRPTSGVSSSIGSNTAKQHKLKQRFTVIRKLGKGTYGKVQLAINKQTGQEVAIKTIKKTKIENEQDLQRVRREIQIMSSIEHPHIIHIYEVFENKDKIVLVMQYAPGGELFEHVSQSKILDDFEARRLFRQIATAIYYCHQNKICHRDLKLENILLDEKSNAKLADFGLSNVFDKNRHLKTFCGSPLYASPEIVRGSPYEGPEVDCWSLGVLLYTLVYGAMPFDGSNFKRLVKQISEACYFEPEQRSLASPLIRRLLCADPGKRATILDICSDPWVNGLSAGLSFDNQYQRIPPNEQQQQQQPHNSLLQVAQDMAKLTPVRFDILLALTQTSPTNTQQQENNENKPPQPLVASTPQTQKRPPRGFATGSKRPPSLDIDPSLMEVDETALATPPVASYIVRDLEVPSNDDVEMAATKEDQQPIEKVKPDEEVSLEQEAEQMPRESELESEVAVLKVEPQQEVDIEVFDGSAMQESDEKSTERQEIEKDKEGDHSISGEVVEQQQESEKSPPNVEQQIIAMDVEEEAGKKPQVEQSMSTEENAQSKEETTTKISSASLNQGQQVDTQIASEEPDQEDKQQAVNTEEAGEKEAVAKDLEQIKPKKVKKKIVVVKKRKKVAKKDAELVPEESNNTQQLEQDDKIKGNVEQVDEKKQNTGRSDINEKKRKPSAPGKVKIPDTFQASPNTESSQTPPRGTPETRRQSALVADVSQKLLQQLQSIANESIKSEQPQLHGVKVADKKDEFERRASQASIMASTSTPTKVSRSGIDYEPERVGSLCESISLLDKLMQTIVEPVEKLEPLKVELLELIEQRKRQQSIDQVSSRESQTTPTSSDKVQQLDQEIKRKLSECAEKLDAEYNKQKSNQNQKADTSPDPNHLNLDAISSARDDRSDSVETIKAESLHDNNPPQIHSSVVIDLGPKKVTESSERAKKDSATSLNSQTAVGPVPIARSYKKVTFTKDGACITETGKIYSTKGDDGTMRRIERKSKITHYPNKDDDDSSREASMKEMKEEEEEEEEIVYGNSDGVKAQTSDPIWRKETRQASSHRSLVTGKPFEKLIMPSTGFIGEFDDDEFERHHPLFSRSSGRESIARIGRNDSNSSCSSSSTDLLDDIFDTWTGAISMFNQNSRRGSSLFDRHNVMFEQAFGGNAHHRHSKLKQSPLFSPHHSNSHHHKQDRMAGGGSVSGTPRSESVEPQFQKDNRRHHRYGERRGDTSGYDSDAPPDRPASALAGARDLFGSSNLFSRQSPKLGSFFNNDNNLFEHDNFSRPQELAFGFDPHMSLRQRLAQQHKQLWKGSTPSLFDDQENQESQFKRQERQHQNLSHFLRPQELQSDFKSDKESAAIRARSSSASQNYSQQTNKQQSTSNWSKPPVGTGIANKQQNLEQSQSSSSFLKGTTAMNANPIRKNTAHIVASSTSESLPPSHPPPHSMQKSTSKASFITSQLSNLQLGNSSNQQQVAMSESASFIELKRSPSSQSSKQKQEHSYTAITKAMSKIISTSTASNASSAFWEGRVSPSNCGDQPENDNEQQAISNQGLGSSKSDNVDAKVQNWLQESSGNISSSLSGSQSSTSDMTHSTKGDPFPSSLQKQSFKPSSIHLTKTKQSSMLVSSSSKQSITPDGGKQQVLKDEFLRHQKADFSGSDGGQVRKATKVSTATFTLRQKSPNDFEIGLDSPNIEQESSSNVLKQESKVFSSASKISTISTTAPIESSKNFEGLNWMETMESTNSSSSRLGQAISGGENFNHHQQTNIQDSCESVDTESKSSSSLLDQLKSRGYRSMIDQRMVSISSSQKEISTNQEQEHQQQQQQQSMSSTSSRVIQSSSRVVMSSSSSSGLRAIQTKKQQFSNITEHKSSNEPATIISDESASQKSVQDEPKLEANFETEESEVGVKTEQPELEESKVVEENSRHEVEEDKLVDTNKGGGGDEDEEDDDDDVREAKANIKPYLDSVKETDMFLKKMHEEEENFERQRQQLFIFNNLMLHTKLNGINSKIASRDSIPTNSGYQFYASSGIRSAPVCNSLSGGVTNSTIEDTQNNVFIPSLALNYEPTYTIPLINNTSTSYYSRSSLQPSAETASFQRSISTFTAPNRNPLEPVQPLNVYSDSTSPSRYSPNRRSRSQLSDQFGDYKRTRPVSANLDLLGTNSNPYFPSRSKRSLSQLRYPTRKISQPTMSEYRSSYVNHSLAATPASFSSAPAYEVDNFITTSNSPTNLNRSDDSDDGMSSYRVSSYVPKIVPQGMQMPHRQGRTFQRRSYRKDADLDLNSQLFSQLDRETSSSNQENYISNGIVERRTSLQPEIARKGAISPENSTSPSTPSSYRRLSLNETPSSSNNANEGSRLSQLELRIQENKKRRDKLLQSSNHSPVNERKSNQEALSTSSPIRTRLGERDSPGSSSTSLRSNNSSVATSGLKAKSSRLESMEARIKRKSYCMRVADCSPDRASQFRGQMSLEKWRSTSTAKSTGVASSSSSPRNSLTNVTKNLFYALSDNSKSNRTGMDSSSSPFFSNVDSNVITQTSETNGI